MCKAKTDNPVIGITWARGTGSSLPSKNKYPILGRPLIEFPLTSVVESGTVEQHYVFTEDDEIAETTLRCGCKVIPRPKHLVSYSDPAFDEDKAWRIIVEYVARDLDLPIPERFKSWINAFFLLTGRFFQLNCNNCMIRPDTLRRMRRFMEERRVEIVVPAVPLEINFQIGMPDGSLYPLMDKGPVNRQEFPPMFHPLSNTRFRTPANHTPNGPNCFYVEVDEIEGMDVHGFEDVEFIEFYLDRHPEHFHTKRGEP